MSIDSTIGIDDQYYADASSTPLLTGQEEIELSARIVDCNQAYDSLIERIRSIFTEKIADSRVQLALAPLRELLPPNFAQVAEKVNVDLSLRAAFNIDNPDLSLIYTACDIARQRIVIQNLTARPRLARETDGIDVDEVVQRLVRVIKLVEQEWLPLTKNLVHPSVREVLETKERVIEHGELARDRMRRANLRLVISNAHRYANRGVDLKDLIEEGNLGLMLAIEKFDHRKGFRFSTYATWWIKQAIQRCVMNHRRSIRVPLHVQHLLFGFRRRIGELETKEGRSIGQEEALQLLEYSEKEACILRRAMRVEKESSLSQEFDNGTGKGSLTLGNSTQDPKAHSPEDELRAELEATQAADFLQFIDALLSVLLEEEAMNEREATIVKLRLGIDERGRKNMSEIGDIFGFSRERARQVQYAALCKLETRIAIMESEHLASQNHDGRKFLHCAEILEPLKEWLGHSGRGMGNIRLSDVQRRKMEEVITGVLNPQMQDVMRRLFGLTGERQSLADIAAHLHLDHFHVKEIRNAALSWIQSALTSRQGLVGIAPTIVPYNDSEGIKNFHRLFAAGQRLLQDYNESDKPRERSNRPEHYQYFDAKDAVVNLDPIFADTVPQKAPETKKQRSTKDRLIELFGETSEFDDARLESLGGSFPVWMHRLNEATATRLHTLLSRNPSASDLKDFFLKANPRYATREDLLGKAVEECLWHSEETLIQLRSWIKQSDTLPETPGKYVRGPGFFRALECNKMIVPNVRRIIEAHFEKNPKPLSERVLIDVGAWDGRLTSDIADMFGKVIAIEPHEERYRQLRTRETENFVTIRQTIQGLGMAPDVYNFKGDIVLLSHILYFLKYEDDERALLWAQKALVENGISIAVLNDRIIDRGSRAHMRKVFQVREKNPSPARYRDFLASRGFPVEVARAGLHLETRTDTGLEALREIMRFQLPGMSRHELRQLDGYIDEFVRNKGKDGSHAFDHNLFFLVAHKHANGNFTMPASPLAPPISSKGVQKGLQELERQKADRSSSPLSITDESQDTEAIAELEREEAEAREFWIGLQKLLREIAQRDYEEKNPPPFVPPPAVPRKIVERSHAKEDVCDNKEFSRLRGKYLRLLYGRHYGHTRYERPLFPKTKKAFRKPERKYNPKIEDRYSEKANNMNEQLVRLREDNPLTVNPKIGEIEVNGKACVKLKYFAQAYNLDLPTLKETIKVLNIEPAGYALSMDSEIEARDMGYKTPVFELQELLGIPYVKERILNDHQFFAEAFSKEKPIEFKQQQDPFLRALDTEIASMHEEIVSPLSHIIDVENSEEESISNLGHEYST